jgi:hypothetical protein
MSRDLLEEAPVEEESLQATLGLAEPEGVIRALIRAITDTQDLRAGCAHATRRHGKGTE